ncbi:UNKNOWN [Stylonychia lemnae]|uniref:Transmembrane protein n=1 Tax=Stylonychia lemnae TaxID=5949 RepID=A0A078AQZ5_STYLE|nr:UNKNOWN [Stylonychia lemnae]|eukprot:CDW84840.1 UNKNOWN [Stylonychia lemnae]
MLQNAITSLDIFGHEIGFTYKNKRTYQSLIGGLTSIMFKVVIMTFLVLELIDVFQRKISISYSNSIRNNAIDVTEYNFDSTKFDIAFTIHEQNQTINDNIQSYVNVKFSQMQFQWSDNSSFQERSFTYNYSRCESGRFNGEKQQTDNFELEKYYWCPDQFNFTLKGSFSSKSNSYIALTFDKCSQTYLDEFYPGKKCQSKDELD